MQTTILKTTELTKEQQKTLEQENIRICKFSDADYPPLLLEIYQPPEVLYYQGTLPKSDNFLFAVVGTRKNTYYAEKVIDHILPPLIQAGAVVVSGLALGVDTLAHQAALKAGAKTIAVLGSGIDKNTLYPHTNYSLAQKIVALGGAIISEYPPFFAPSKITFPARNRIIAGLARGLLVIEAPRKSGALITAFSALEQGRDIFAVPGDISRAESEGCNELIKRGAKPVLRTEDILEEYGLETSVLPKQNLNITLDKDETIVVSLLDNEPRHVDELARKSNLPISATSGLLSLLEIKGVVKNVGGMKFIRL